jgi:hypothetical protein
MAGFLGLKSEVISIGSIMCMLLEFLQLTLIIVLSDLVQAPEKIPSLLRFIFLQLAFALPKGRFFW